ncbi:hypothetical protein AGMMS49579_21380 [Spirochaetia bacterium]|nr:hypothetical protein AGMMS49579_21380 [Spirochaetia bacterium]
MANALGESSWWVITIDDDRKEFSVHGPVEDDTPCELKAGTARKTRKGIHICTVAANNDIEANLIKQYKNQNLNYVKGCILGVCC